MPNLNWEKLNKIKLGKYAEQYAKMEFSSYCFDVYSNDVDDHGVDFIVKSPSSIFYEIQVKSIRIDKNHSAEIDKTKMNLSNERFLVCFVIFKEKELPCLYLLKPNLWSENNNGDLSKIFHTNPTNYSIRPYKKNLFILNNFSFDKQIVFYL